ncbi:hypothetical protein M9H77_14229 [Catharanthus roseus]|uniref:Uncharacterized protein n=1 Tax=Catharanthus roseus TaxID=4058 RepID=A0ACC0BMG8_CATRO|nr:hypothetical protein M9H77_14229 [Catharanthus roseus]
MKTSFRPGLKFVENQVSGRVSGLHCTWLVPRTRASSDDVDGFLTLRSVAQPVFTWTSHHALRWDGRLVEGQEGLETEIGPRADLLGAPGISSGRSGTQQATKVRPGVFGSNLPEGHMSMFYLFRLQSSVKFLFMLSCKVVDCREVRRCPTQP